MAAEVTSSAAHPVVTIGYGSRRSAEELVALLKAQGVRFLVDVRSSPYSKFRPEFSQAQLKGFVEEAGLRYVFLGDTLGGRPSDPSCYTDGHVDYAKCRRTESFQAGVQRLVEGSTGGHTLALLCAELEPENCHRSKLVGQALADAGIVVLHIDGRGRIRTQVEIMAAVEGHQPGLFGVELRSRKRYALPEDEHE